MFDFNYFLRDSNIELAKDITASLNHLFKIKIPIELRRFEGLFSQILLNATVLLVYRFLVLWSTDELSTYFNKEFLIGVLFIILGYVTYFVIVQKLIYIEYIKNGSTVYPDFESELREFIHRELITKSQTESFKELKEELFSLKKELNCLKLDNNANNIVVAVDETIHTTDTEVQDNIEILENKTIQNSEEEETPLINDTPKKLDKNKKKKIKDANRKLMEKIALSESVAPKNFDTLFIPNTNEETPGAPIS